MIVHLKLVVESSHKLVKMDSSMVGLTTIAQHKSIAAVIYFHGCRSD